MKLMRLRFSVRRLMFVIAVFGLLFGGGAWALRERKAPVPIPVFLHPLAIDSTTLDVLGLAGIKVKGCDFAVPTESKVTVVVVSRDQKGIIKELSRIYRIANGEGSGRICMMRIDPEATIEEKTNRLHWVLEVDGMKLSHWIDDPFGSGFYSNWVGVQSIEDPLPGRTYKVGEYKVARMGINPGAPIFSMQIRFKFEPLKPTDQPGSMVMGYSKELDTTEASDAKDPNG